MQVEKDFCFETLFEAHADRKRDQCIQIANAIDVLWLPIIKRQYFESDLDPEQN